MKRWLLPFLILGFLVSGAGTAQPMDGHLCMRDTSLRQIKEAVKACTSLDEHRYWQAQWEALEPTAMQCFYDSLAASEPANPEYEYLRLRYQSVELQLPQTGALIAAHPDFYWGFKLFALALCETILSSRPLPITQSDVTILHSATQKFHEKQEFYLALMLIYQKRGDHDTAATWLNQLSDPTLIAANWQIIDALALELGDQALYSQKLPALISVYIQSGIINQADSLAVYGDQVSEFGDRLHGKSGAR
ncbi:MAG: hypothetical protein KBB33_03645 [Candidatus Cloacimonetes bacterium]|nr:hypothetical protein [Candidatus Cloacimonadota bacterium]HOA29738.1 hypothetical protein [Candidatus Cloacimonadota bacterium]